MLRDQVALNAGGHEVIKLCDFGSAVELPSLDREAAHGGSAYWRAPDPYISAQSDVYSAVLVCVELVLQDLMVRSLSAPPPLRRCTNTSQSAALIHCDMAT